MAYSDKVVDHFNTPRNMGSFTIDEAAKIKNTDIVQELNLPPVKIHCSVLAEDAIKAALADYKKKAQEQVPTAEGQAK